MQTKILISGFLLILPYSLTDLNDERQVKFVAAVFRHGDCTPDYTLVNYPSNPNINRTYYPIGFGGLTNDGKRRLYYLGKVLKQRYNSLLGDTYYPEMLQARSTDFGRTQMSLELVLASLYPPQGTQMWLEGLNWQPIPISSVPIAQDHLMIPDSSKMFVEERNRVLELMEVQREVENFRPLIENFTRNAGKAINSTLELYNLYHNFVSETAMNLTLPNWTQNLFPYGPLRDATVFQYKIFNYNKKMRKMAGGMILKNIINTMKTIISDGSKRGRRINLFSGHNTNVAALLSSLHVWKPHVPEYGSAVIVELVSRHENFYVEVHYYLGIPATLEKLFIPGCNGSCSFDAFLEIMHEEMPWDS